MRNKISINLLINGEEKEYSVKFISIATMEKIFDVIDEMEKQNSHKDIFNILIKFILDIFEGQFTEDELKNGIDAREFISITMGIINNITDAFGGK